MTLKHIINWGVQHHGPRLGWKSQGGPLKNTTETRKSPSWGQSQEGLRVIWSTTRDYCGGEKGRAWLSWSQRDRKAELKQAPRAAGFAPGRALLAKWDSAACISTA